MGEGVSSHISKGVVNKKVDALLNETSAAGQFHKRAAFLAAVKTAPDAQAYLTVLRTQAGVTAAQSDYMRDTWYEEGPQGLWPWLQPVYPVLVRGLIKTIEVAQQANLPVDTYWIAAGDQVEVFVAQSKAQVTRLVMTPPIYAPTLNRPNDMTLWTIQRGSAQEQPGRATMDAIVEGVQDGIVTWRVRDF